MKSVQIDGFDSAERCVDRSQNNNGDGCADVNEKRFCLARPNTSNHFVGQHERDRRYIQARAGREHARENENRRCGVFRRHAETRGEIFVDRIDFVVVVRLDENVADQNASQDGAERELQISVISKGETFPRRAKKSAGTRLRGDKRGENGPPRNCATAQREIFEVLFLPAHVKPDGNDDDEIQEQNCGIDREPGVHAGGHFE